MPWILIGLVALGTGAYFVTKKKAAEMSLDATLTADQRTAVRFAIQKETSASTLRDMSNQMTPDLPLTAKALSTRAGEL